MYLDDGLGVPSGFDAACKDSQLVHTTLESASFPVHPTKTAWEPSQRVIWLGFVVDLALGQIQVPVSKIIALRSILKQAERIPFVKARYLASMLGKIVSMSLAFGPVSRFMTCSLYAVLESRQSWSEPLQLTQDAEDELTFWPSELRTYNAQPIWPPPPHLLLEWST